MTPTDLREAARLLHPGSPLLSEMLTEFADSFDQPGDGPLAYCEGRMVRMDSVSWLAGDGVEFAWRFPAALEDQAT